METDCIFCQIVAGNIPGEILHQDENTIAFRDIHPIASTHLLIVPKRHIPSLAHISEQDLPLMGHMVGVANRLAKKEGIYDSGYRLVINCGEQSGQLVPHLHIHLIGGRRLSDELG
ncbi:histidine triad nucleotide-binding protein [Chloroflexota bacterium]